MSSFDSTYYSGINQQIPAKDYIQSFWIKMEATTDQTSSIPIQLCEFENGVYTDYLIDIPSAGQYMLNLRIANKAGINPKFKIYSNDNLLNTQEVVSTGGLDIWQTKTVPITLPAGKQTLRITSSGTSGCKMLWFNLTDLTDIKNTNSLNCEVFVDNNHQLQIISTESISEKIIFDCTGKKILSGKTTDMSAFKNGIYIVKILFKNGKKIATKLIIHQ